MLLRLRKPETTTSQKGEFVATKKIQQVIEEADKYTKSEYIKAYTRRENTMMTWREFKIHVDKQLEEKKIPQDKEIWYIDISFPKRPKVRFDDALGIVVD